MKYAVPITGGALSQHFGHCEQFALINVDESTKEIVQKQMVTPPPHEPGLLPRWLADMGVSYVIAGGMGGRAIELFAQNGIGVSLGAIESDPEKAVQNHLDDSLVTGANVCNHDAHDCSH